MTIRLSWPSGAPLPGLHLACALDNIRRGIKRGDRRVVLPGRTADDLRRLGRRLAICTYAIDMTDPAAPVLVIL